VLLAVDLHGDGIESVLELAGAPGEPARVVSNLEIRPRPGPAGVQFLKRLPGEV